MPLTLTAICTRLFAIIVKFPGFPPGWGGETVAVANSIALGHGFASPYGVETGPTALIPPVYPYLLSIFFRLFGPGSEMAGVAALGLNVLLSALVLIPLYVLAQRLFNTQTARVSVWVWALLPLTGYTDALYIWNTSLVALTLTAFLALTLSVETADLNARQTIPYALFAGFAILLEPASAVVVGVAWLWLAYRKMPIRNLAQILAVASIFPCAWTARNFAAFHEPVFIRSGLGLEVSRGIRDYEFTSDSPSSLPNRNPDELEKYEQMGELGYMQYRFDEALQWIRENPRVYGERIVRRVVAYWTGYRVSQIYLFYGRFEELKRLLFALPVLGVALSVFFLKKRDLFLVYPMLLLYPIVFYLTHVELRYRLPLEPLLIGMTIGSLLALCQLFLARLSRISGFARIINAAQYRSTLERQ